MPMEGGTEQSTAPKGPFPLNRPQRRVLGVLIEKAFCTPEYYPLTVNALVSGCNQKSNRDPVISFEAHQIEEVLAELQQAGLVVCLFPATGRTERWKHILKDAWALDRPERAVLGELLLRGAQSEGEMRSRASRMVKIATLEELQSVLASLAQRGFTRRLSPEEQSRGVVWTHLLVTPEELARIEQRVRESAPGPAASAPSVRTAESVDSAVGPLVERVTKLEHELEAARSRVSDLEGRLSEMNLAQQSLERELQALRQELGA